VPEHCLVPLPASVSVADGCLVEPLAVALHGLRRARIGSGHRLCVIGGGTIGLCAVATARALGADVALDARHDAQRRAGEQLGAGEARDVYDVVVDCAGTKSALERAVRLCRPGGVLILLASYWDGMAMPGIPLCMKEIQVLPSSLYSRRDGVRDFEMAAGILAERREISPALISHRFSLNDASDAFEAAGDRAAGAIKVVLEA
jgi:threonine dehydrogenase-like Zn-dependent dehydrogenase